jgi:hypothetical protein
MKVGAFSMAHFAIHGIMHESALKADKDPDRLSFLQALRVIRRKLTVFLALSLASAVPCVTLCSTKFSMRTSCPVVTAAAGMASSAR